MPQYEVFFFQWQGLTSKLFIKNTAALRSELGGWRKHKEGMMFVMSK